ncbi:NADH-quinone oxidoreductase subunit B family protein [Chlorobium phaeobacteroides]|jgi:coenzyme F420-reducing hydrogenase gamma subunit|uniref:NADH ubiquinone oxidoreductase, 20 kDa subunit n=1 Tax=Chlorobium phaeobacteroides (strain DSM 266 / SMG 266 / 2430) TaxID=290317 RepID=A1BIE6_CHLPD|nr:NADH ubiquinone oxidoreductase [Chlorobium phaeobacteroides]ABL66173.1 NADH ubiquinone oxidoreductase, 20 kDa subunit [Chlorobium phaeobacteroides DSM 266]MBV5327290.1 NADH:ubiquinone oxidoreductase [Chlorobium sp.]
MNQQGMHFEKLKFASFEFTCCEGCQLQLANHESSLAAFFDLLDVRAFREISSEKHDDYDIAFVEGSISRNDEIERLLTIRRQAKTLVAFGTCACFGGVNSLKNRFPIEECIAEVYDSQPIESLPVRKISDFVKVDLSIPGCPVAKEEVERIVVCLVTSSLVTLPKYPVCVECKEQLNTCLFDLGDICLGPITRAGCNAVCTSGKTPCLGCRGPAEDINFPAFMELVKKRGLNRGDLQEKLGFYNAFEAYRNDET